MPNISFYYSAPSNYSDGSKQGAVFFSPNDGVYVVKDKNVFPVARNVTFSSNTLSIGSTAVTALHLEELKVKSYNAATIERVIVDNSIHGFYYDYNFNESSSYTDVYTTDDDYLNLYNIYRAAYKMWNNEVSIVQILCAGNHNMLVSDVGPAFLQSTVGVNPPIYYGLEIYISCEGFLYELQICSNRTDLSETPSPEVLHGRNLILYIKRKEI